MRQIPPALLCLLALSVAVPAAAQVSWDGWTPPPGDDGQAAERRTDDRWTEDRRPGDGWSDGGAIRGADPAAADADAPPEALQCQGNEPFWSLRIVEGRATLERPDGNGGVWAADEVQPVANRSDRWVVPLRPHPRGRTDGYVVLGRTPACSDTMSDRDYPYDALLIGVQAEPVSGCCDVAETTPQVSVSPDTAIPGESVVVEATGLPPSTDVMIAAGPSEADLAPLLPARTDNLGRVRAEVPLPAAAGETDSYVFGVRLGGGRTAAISDPIRIDGDPEVAGPARITGTVSSEGVECPAVRGDDGRLYTLEGRGMPSLRPGDRITVLGTPVQVSYCQQGTTLEVRQIDRVGD